MSTDAPSSTPLTGPVPGAERAADAQGGRLRSIVSGSAFRYLAVGASAFAVDVGLLALLHDGLHLTVWLATAIAFLLSFAYTYVMQRLAFRSRAAHGRALVRYCILVAVNTVATAAMVQAISGTSAGWFGGKVLATAVTTVWNYFAYRYWVFRQPAESDAAPREDA